MFSLKVQGPLLTLEFLLMEPRQTAYIEMSKTVELAFQTTGQRQHTLLFISLTPR